MTLFGNKLLLILVLLFLSSFLHGASLTLAFLTFIFPCTFLMKLHGLRLAFSTKVCCWLVIVAGVLGSIAGIESNIAVALGNSK